MESCALLHDHGYCSFTRKVGGKILNELFVFGQGRIQIPSLPRLFDFIIWNK